MPKSTSGRYNFSFKEKHIVANFLAAHQSELSSYTVDELLAVLKPLVGKEVRYDNVRRTANEVGIEWKPKRVVNAPSRNALHPRVDELEEKVAALELTVEELVKALAPKEHVL